MKTIWLAFITLFLLSACGRAVRSLTPSTTEENPIATKSNIILTSIPSQTPYSSVTPDPTATDWIKTYPTKKALVVYASNSRNEYTMNFIEWGDFYKEPYLVLYEDGQLMFGIGGSVKPLSKTETEEILLKLEQLGFFQIKSNSEADILKGMQNPIYVHPTEGLPAPMSAWPDIELTVNGPKSNSISYRREWENYLIQPMKEIIAYLNGISSDGAMPYQPDRMLVGFDGEENKRIPEDATIIPWPEDVTSPRHWSYMGVLYLEGAEVQKLYQAAGEKLYAYFTFEGKNYSVYLRPILPHECHIYHLYEEAPPAQPYFTCDDW
jgi:hypothetical protein